MRIKVLRQEAAERKLKELFTGTTLEGYIEASRTTPLTQFMEGCDIVSSQKVDGKDRIALSCYKNEKKGDAGFTFDKLRCRVESIQGDDEFIAIALPLIELHAKLSGCGKLRSSERKETLSSKGYKCNDECEKSL